MDKENLPRPEEQESPYGPAGGTGPAVVPLSREGLLRAAERSGVIFFRWDVSGGFLYISDSVASVLGYTTAELLSDPMLYVRLVHQESAKELEGAIRRLQSEEPERAQFLTRMRARDGRDVWLSSTVHKVVDESGALAGWEGVSIDATELIRAREAAFEGQQVFRTLFEDGPMPMILFDPHTLVVERANGRACNLYRYSRGDLEGSFISEMVAPDEWSRTLDHVQRASQDSFVSILHRTHHRKSDGTLFPVQVAGANVMVGGRVKRIAVVLDLSDSEAAGERGRAISFAVEAAPTPIAVLDTSLAFVHINPAFERATGATREAFLGTPLDRHLDEATARLLREREPGLVRGERVELRAAVIRTALPELKATITLVPLALPDNTNGGFALLLDPPTAAPTQAMAASDAELFFDLIVHDVTNYLTAVRGYLELVIAASNAPASTMRLATIARDQSTNALDLIRDTRKLANLERDPHQAAAEGDLVALLDEAVDRVAPIVQSRKVKVRRDYRAPKAPVRSPDLLREVFVNLLHNAVKFDAHDEVVIDLTVEKTLIDGKPAWRVRVADRGVGVAEADRARLFDRGFKASRPSARAPGTMAPAGSGIGLSLCRMVVERANGTISVESRIPGDPGQGAAFILTLPAA